MPATDTVERVNQNTAHHDAELVPVSPPQTRALTPPRAWQEQLGGRPNLAAALARAILACHPVRHDGEVKYGGTQYTYASSEAILLEGRRAMAEAGIVLIPVEHSVNGHEREGPDRYELVRKFLLLHTSGESVTVGMAWPIIPQQGRALDKATAAADTLSLSYFVRDLLLMPRVDPADEVNQRRDEQPRQAAPKKDKAAKPPPPANGVELRDRVEARDANLAAKGRIKAGELIQYVSAALVRGDHSAALALAAGPALECALAAAREFEQKLAAKTTP